MLNKRPFLCCRPLFAKLFFLFTHNPTHSVNDYQMPYFVSRHSYAIEKRKDEHKCLSLFQGKELLLAIIQQCELWVQAMGLKKLYLDIYEQFAKKYDTVKGYNFQEDHRGSTSPKMVAFKDRIKWWTLDRPKRLRVIKQERDRQQQEILAIKQPRSTP